MIATIGMRRTGDRREARDQRGGRRHGDDAGEQGNREGRDCREQNDGETEPAHGDLQLRHSQWSVRPFGDLWADAERSTAAMSRVRHVSLAVLSRLSRADDARSRAPRAHRVSHASPWRESAHKSDVGTLMTVHDNRVSRRRPAVPCLGGRFLDTTIIVL